LQYDRSFGDHNLGLLAGNEQQYTYTESWGADRRGQSDVFYDEYQGGYNSIVAAGNFLAENYLVSFFGRLSYNYKRKYIISANVRRDGYSAFGAGNQYGNFAGGGAAWVLSEEDFFKNSGVGKTISNLKFKASYGRVGNNQGINDYAARSLFGSGLYGAEPTLFYGVAANRDLRWETSTKTDLGMEIGFLNNRFTAEFTYYKNVVDDMILAAPQAPSRGIPGNSILTNVGKMTNTGFEVQLNAAIVQGKDFQWNSSFNIGTVKNVVNELAAGNADIFPDIQAGITERPSIIRVGESIGSFYAVPTVGVNPDNGRRLFQLRDGTVVQYNHAAIAAGQPAWTKLDGTPAPRVPDQGRDGVIIGPALPKFSGGFDNTFRYKGFDLNVLFFFSGGNYIYNGTKAGLRDQRNWNNSTEVLNRWQKAGDVTSIPRLVFGDNISNGSGLVISENVEKGDFIKARNVAFGYTIPRSLMQRINFSSARLYVSAQNLFTITNYSGFDPEVSTTGNANGNPSVDRNVVPQARTITFGINIGF
jgi:TonB-linked SusC/RagA family outer membrane protein